MSGKVRKQDIDGWLEIYQKETHLIDNIMDNASKFSKEHREELREAYRNKEITEIEMKEIQNKLDMARSLVEEYLGILIDIRKIQYGRN